MDWEGKLLNGEQCYIHKLDKTGIEEIIGLQQIVLAALTEKSLLQPLSIAEFDYILSGNGVMVGAFTNNKLIAYRAFLIPSPREEYLACDAGLKEEEIEQVIYSEVSVVDPVYRGNRLQTKMGKLLLKQLDTTKFKYVLATVSPYNIPSLKDKFELGMKIVALKEKYEGKLRFIFKKTITNQNRSRNDCQKLYVNTTAIDEQQQILKIGYQGVAIENKDGEWLILYEKAEGNT